uniref:umecyanin-like n=1 Tax=Erigeron canadensis TaxID=72917 RepID=UPI001CB921D2|nr:umecyanin-like [Erigeron canadensis]
MAFKFNMLLCMAMVASMAFHSSAQVFTHVVGDTAGWNKPSIPTLYADWAGSQIFEVNDILKFNFKTGEEDLGEVSKQGYDQCNNHGLVNYIKEGPANITLTEPGPHYFVCLVGDHCEAGQKLNQMKRFANKAKIYNN